MFDKFFDCLNVCSITEHLSKRKPDLQPYHSISDARLKVFMIAYMYIRTALQFLFIVLYSCPLLQWLKEEFLGYLSTWETEVEQRAGFTRSMKQSPLKHVKD